MDKKYIRLHRRIDKNLPASNEERLLYLKNKYKNPFKLCFCELIATTTWTTADGVFAKIAPLLAKSRWDLWILDLDELEDNIIDQIWSFIEKDRGRFSVSKYFFPFVLNSYRNQEEINLIAMGKYIIKYLLIGFKNLQ